MAYKKLIKVSNVCQVLDKRTYPATTTINGVAFTNNGDGTITANGTATGLCQYRITKSYKKLIGENTNKCLLVGSISANSGTPYYLQLDFLEGNSWSRAALDFGKGVIFTNSDSSTQLLSIIVKSGVTVNNLVFKPQLFDLTEMYGAGNEPTTVEQFRQDFPEEMYDYSPYCWLTSYKRIFMTGGGNYLTSYQRNLTCKTKNLFDINSVTEVRHIRTGQLKPTTKWSIKNNSFITTLNNYSDGVSYILPTLSLKPGIYTFSAFCTSDYEDCWFGIYDFTKSEGFDERYTANKQLSKTFEITEKSEIGLIMQGYNKSSNVTYSNVQLELGDTATNYVPYGHL